MEPFTVFASTCASSCAGSSAVTEPLIVVAETPPVSPNASTRTRTSPFIDSAFTGPFAVATSTSPLIVWITRGPRAPVTWTSPTMVVAPRLAPRGSRTVKSTATSLCLLPRSSTSPCPGPQAVSLPQTAHTATPPSYGTATRRTLALSEPRNVFTAETCSESPRAGSTVTDPRVFRIHTHCFAPSLERYVHVAAVERPGPPSSRVNSLRRSRRATGRFITLSCTTRCAACTAKPITSTAQNNAVPRMISLRQVSQNALTPAPCCDRLQTGRSYDSWRGGVSRARRRQVVWLRGAEAPPRNVQETAWNLDGCASVHRTVGRLKTLPWVAAACAPSLRDSTVTGSSTPPYHTPSRAPPAGIAVAGSVAVCRPAPKEDTAIWAAYP